MADLSVTIAVTTTVMGLSPATVWNQGQWGSFNWGYTGDFVTEVTKGIDNSEAATTSFNFEVTHAVEESLPSDSTLAFEYEKHIDVSVSPTSGLPAWYLQDGSGYFYVFPDRTTDGEERDYPTWTSGAVAAGAWTSSTVGSTTWS